MQNSRIEVIEKTVLLVEDQSSLAMVASEMLRARWGCEVLVANTLAQAIVAVETRAKDIFLAVSDLNLPDANNGEVVDMLLKAHIPTIALTGLNDRAALDQLMDRGVVDYALKTSINAYEYVVELVGRYYRNQSTKVLVVDDSVSFVDMLKTMLLKQGLQVFTAADGVLALQQMEAHPDIKLIITDYEMPNLNGPNLLAKLRKAFSKDELAVIGVSGTEDKHVSADFLKLGANDYINKPFSYEELVCRVSNSLQMLESINAIRYEAHHDFLTGLLNRRAFYSKASKLSENAKKQNLPLALAAVDIDNFKAVNDKHGHDAGDLVLKHFAISLSQHFNRDTVARLGGEEFVVLSDDADNFIEACDSFRRFTEANYAKFGDISINFTVSIGLSIDTNATLDDMLKLADARLYAAKAGGRNKVLAV